MRNIYRRVELEAGCKISIDTDAHNVPGFNNLPYGIITARQGSMEPESCINT